MYIGHIFYKEYQVAKILSCVVFALFLFSWPVRAESNTPKIAGKWVCTAELILSLSEEIPYISDISKGDIYEFDIENQVLEVTRPASMSLSIYDLTWANYFVILLRNKDESVPSRYLLCYLHLFLDQETMEIFYHPISSSGERLACILHLKKVKT